MKIKNLKINKNKFKELHNQVIALTLATTIPFALSGCTKKYQEIGFALHSSTNKSDFVQTSGLYSYVINDDGFISLPDNRKISFAKISNTKSYVDNAYSDLFYRDNIEMIWPSCYDCYTGDSYKNECMKKSNWDFDIKVEYVDELLGNSFVIIYSSMTAKEDLTPISDVLENDQKIISKGDTMSSIAIYHGNDKVAYKQTGIGCECENVINATKGDVDLALSTVREYGLITETTDIGYENLVYKQTKLNEKATDKTLKKVK